jgi:hypothetical protein
MSDIIRSSEEMKKIIGLYLLGQTDIADIMFKHIINEYRAECNIIMKNMVDEYYKGNVPQITTIPELSEEGKKYHLNKAFICPNYKYKSIFFFIDHLKTWIEFGGTPATNQIIALYFYDENMFDELKNLLSEKVLTQF